MHTICILLLSIGLCAVEISEQDLYSGKGRLEILDSAAAADGGTIFVKFQRAEIDFVLYFDGRVGTSSRGIPFLNGYPGSQNSTRIVDVGRFNSVIMPEIKSAYYTKYKTEFLVPK